MRKRGNFCFKTDIGRVRLSNEDRVNVLANASGDVLMVVCDGLGGHNKGDYASKLTVDYISEAFRKKNHFRSRFGLHYWIKKTIRRANALVYNESEKNVNYQGMGTTLVMAVIHNDRLFLANIGDSRAYLIKKDYLQQITQDQTYVDFLERTGQISKEQADAHAKKHMLLNALGIYPSVSMDITQIDYHDESIFLCSDGLYNNLSENEAFAILISDDTVEQKCESLIAVANSNGGSDNIAVAIWENDDD